LNKDALQAIDEAAMAAANYEHEKSSDEKQQPEEIMPPLLVGVEQAQTPP
jgi:hypothetical protein